MAIPKIAYFDGLKPMPKILLSRNTEYKTLDSDSDVDSEYNTDLEYDHEASIDFHITEVEYTVHLNDIAPQLFLVDSDACFIEHIHDTYALNDNEDILNIEIMEYNIDTIIVKLSILEYDD
jgi:hypothetical protein